MTISVSKVGHIVLKVGDSLEELAEVKRVLATRSVAVHMALDHHVARAST